MRHDTAAPGAGTAPAARVIVTTSVDAPVSSRSAPSAKSTQARTSGVLSLLPSPVMPKAVRGGSPFALRARTVADGGGIAVLKTT